MNRDADGVNGLTAERLPDWIKWRHHLHAHPELGFQEHATASFLVDRLVGLGWEISKGVGGTGIVARRAGTSGRRTIALRADMDALPISEDTGLSYRSGSKGVMHACGHDGHMAMLLGAADLLARQSFDADILLIFQPAEEGGGGAQAMIDDGLFERWAIDEIFAIHNHPGLPRGCFGLVDGPVMASYDEFAVTFRGNGGHAAFPHHANDVVLAAAHFVTMIQAIVARSTDPMRGAVVSATKLAAGTARNVMPESATVEGSLRAFEPEVRDRTADLVRRHAASVAQGFGVEADVELSRLYAPTINNRGPTMRARRVVTGHFGAEALAETGPQPASDDFGAMLTKVPGCYVLLGSGDHDHVVSVHHPRYDFNDHILEAGVRFWAGLILDFAAGPNALTAPAQQ